MSEFAPPSGPPPPKVPEGWKAVWNAQYSEWFYVNTHTKQSQWDKPTEPVYSAPAGGPQGGPPPGYDHSQSKPTGPEKGGFGSNNPYNSSGPGQSSVSEDEKLARQLQAEEEQRARSSGGNANRGAADSYYQGGAPSYGQQNQSPYGQQQSPAPQEQTKSKGGLFSKLSSKLGGGSSSSRPMGYGQQGYPQQYPPQQGYGGYPPPQQYGGYPPQGGYYQQPQRRTGGGMGAGGGALLGAGAGLVGGALLMDAIDDNQQEAYQEGYEDGGGGDDFGGDDGGDF